MSLSEKPAIVDSKSGSEEPELESVNHPINIKRLKQIRIALFVFTALVFSTAVFSFVTAVCSVRNSFFSHDDHHPHFRNHHGLDHDMRMEGFHDDREFFRVHDAPHRADRPHEMRVGAEHERPSRLQEHHDRPEDAARMGRPDHNPEDGMFKKQMIKPCKSKKKNQRHQKSHEDIEAFLNQLAVDNRRAVENFLNEKPVEIKDSGDAHDNGKELHKLGKPAKLDHDDEVRDRVFDHSEPILVGFDDRKTEVEVDDLDLEFLI
ncbi:unnamed protein product [Kuraishia capsulata CBS 1993]|uniref:Uncharacterized protein n=1 Tax=Kuraishia capsulata CBS 1993 TaxID=1382522 RepID=W6MUE8_9ASCO|nr:uncharacterized protein KUCA_T00005200001 [Kuraishia capsulata CBS 1993]CDK29212.1 unnamed protein product [Kuraishia capsulata CBS 1993]